ncbi:NUDIX domain-containing protein, partial [Patescibacteria group bacterium]|nr:NUDIX domain-containing protein [Patescibacteria group bacterium]
MSDIRYQYDKEFAIKVIVENPKGNVLLIQEPETNEWMPGHWGLPGGKPLEKESLYQAFKRKTKEELEQDLEPVGIYKIEELLIEGRTVLMFHAVVHVKVDIKPA